MKNFTRALVDGIPIMLGYLSVSFGLGILVMKSGLSVLSAVMISAANLTSAGQVAGLSVIVAGGTLVELIFCQLVINIRYSLMGFSLSQKLDSSFKTPQRLIVSFGITDEIFAVASAQKGKINARYMYGLITVSFVGWVSGTLLGAVAGEFLPAQVTDALGLMLYAMFIAIIVPPAKKNYRVLFVVLFALALSLFVTYVCTFISAGFSVIICALISSVICALVFPISEEEEV